MQHSGSNHIFWIDIDPGPVLDAVQYVAEKKTATVKKIVDFLNNYSQV
jgi:hypothetical protein